jgi:hypothetical protein
MADSVAAGTGGPAYRSLPGLPGVMKAAGGPAGQVAALRRDVAGFRHGSSPAAR